MITSRDYEKIILQLEDLYGNSESFAKDGSQVWQDDMKALREAIDIISDYEKLSSQVVRLTERYETKQGLIREGINSYSCPRCEALIRHPKRNHCHNCGQRLSWAKTIRTR